MNKIMENNEEMVQEETQEQDTASSAEQTETQENSQEETVEELKAKVAKYKAIAERKDKKLQDKEINKPKSEQTGLSREETIFFAQGGTEETYEIAKKIAETQNISILAAKEDDYFKFQVEKIEKEKQVKANQIKGSQGSQTGAGHTPKPLSKMTADEHRDYAREKYGMR